MPSPPSPADDIFQPGGRLRLDLVSPAAVRALEESIRLARDTRWDSVRSPHVFMGLLAKPDSCVQNWAKRLGVDLDTLLQQFQEIFYQEQGVENAVLVLNREFLSDNVIRMLREACGRARSQQRNTVTSMDLLITLFTASNSIVAECFERIGVTAAKLTELAMMAEQQANHD